MKGPEVIETYLAERNYDFDEVEEGLWLISRGDEMEEHIVVAYNPPILLLRLKVMDIPQRDNEELFGTLLRLNATDMHHGAYGIEEDSIVITDTLEVESVNPNELQASIDSLSLAASQHYKLLKKFR